MHARMSLTSGCREADRESSVQDVRTPHRRPRASWDVTSTLLCVALVALFVVSVRFAVSHSSAQAWARVSGATRSISPRSVPQLTSSGDSYASKATSHHRMMLTGSAKEDLIGQQQAYKDAFSHRHHVQHQVHQQQRLSADVTAATAASPVVAGDEAPTIAAPSDVTPPRLQYSGRSSAPPPRLASLYDLDVVNTAGFTESLSQFKGTVTLVVTAPSSSPLFMDNIQGLLNTFNKYRYHGFRVLAFPCTQDGSVTTELQTYAEQHARELDVFGQTEVSGGHASAAFKFLRSHLPASQGKDLSCDFSKILVGANGLPKQLYGPEYDVSTIEHDLYKTLYDLLHEYL